MPSYVILPIALLVQSTFCSGFDPTTHRAWHLFNDQGCGIRTQQRVVGGEDASIGEFPWMAPIYFSKQEDNVFETSFTSCGAAIISEQFILTAAHCNPNLPNESIFAEVVTGELDKSRDPDCDENGFCPPSIKKYTVEKFISHHGYSYSGVGDDIALAKIEGKFEYDGYATPICLEYGPLLSDDYAGEMAEMAGWGIYKFDPVTDADVYPFMLQKITVPIQDENACNQSLLLLVKPYFYDKINYDSFICAGGNAGEHIYYGDSGAVLVVTKAVDEDIPRFYGIGVTALTFEEKPRRQASTAVADGYTRISYYMEWILDTIADELGI